MASKSFAINTEPHVATVGPHVFEFEPEAIGAQFAQAHSELVAAQTRVSEAGDNASVDDILAVNAAIRAFLTNFMLPSSRDRFKTIQLPDRVLVQLLEWLAEVYGGGQGNGDIGSSSAA